MSWRTLSVILAFVLNFIILTIPFNSINILEYNTICNIIQYVNFVVHLEMSLLHADLITENVVFSPVLVSNKYS